MSAFGRSERARGSSLWLWVSSILIATSVLASVGCSTTATFPPSPPNPGKVRVSVQLQADPPEGGFKTTWEGTWEATAGVATDGATSDGGQRTDLLADVQSNGNQIIFPDSQFLKAGKWTFKMVVLVDANPSPFFERVCEAEIRSDHLLDVWFYQSFDQGPTCVAFEQDLPIAG